MRSEGSARRKCWTFFWVEGAVKGADTRSEEWKMMMASPATQQQARMWHARRVSSVFLQRHLRTLAVFHVFSAVEPSTKSGDGVGVILDACFPQEVFFCVAYTCAVIKTSLCKRVETQTCDVEEGSTQHC